MRTRTQIPSLAGRHPPNFDSPLMTPQHFTPGLFDSVVDKPTSTPPDSTDKLPAPVFIKTTPILDSSPLSSPVQHSKPAAPSALSASQVDPGLMVKLRQFSSAVSDTVIAPKPFTGLSDDTDAAENWLAYFERYAQYRSLNNDDKLRLFGMLLRDTAADWLSTLNDKITKSFDLLRQEFILTYFKSDQLKWLDAKKLFGENMSSDEKVEQYVTRMKRAARHLNISQELLNYAIVSGLRPNIRTHVLSQGLKDLNDTIRAAKIAECSLTSDPTSLLLLEALQSNKQTAEKQALDLKTLNDQVKDLATAIVNNTAVSALNQTQPQCYPSQQAQYRSQAPTPSRPPRLTPQRQQRMNFPFQPPSQPAYTPRYAPPQPPSQAPFPHSLLNVIIVVVNTP